MNRYSVARSAKEDLIEHLAYLSSRSQTASERLALRLIKEFRYLAEWPSSGRKRPEFTNADVRFWPVGSYWILYRQVLSGVFIVRVVHSKQDLATASLHLEEPQDSI